MIPNLAESGYLPVGRYLASAREVEERFATNERRVDLWNSLKKVMDLLEAALGEKPHIWLSGSFLSSKEQPGDLDIVVLIDNTAMSRLSRFGLYIIDTVGRNLLRENFGLEIDSFILEVDSPIDASSPLDEYLLLKANGQLDAGGIQRDSDEEYYLYRRGYWDNLWSATRDKQGRLVPCSRGYLEVMADAS